MKNLLRRINWTNSLFLIITPIVAIIGTASIIYQGHLNGWTVLWAILFTGATGVTITAGYHRLFSHRTYVAAWPVKVVFLLLGAACFEGSALEWSTDHRNHHLYTDTDRDPYSVTKSFWHAHMGWLLTLDTSARNFNNVKDLTADPLVQWQHRFFVPLAILMGFIFPMAIASLWGDPWGGLIIAGALRIAFNHQVTFCINSVCHVFGKNTYSTEISARDNWVTALFTYGEGFHNYHHKFMFDYRNGINFYHFDPAKWVIRSLAFFGLATNLRRASQKLVIRHVMQVDESYLMAQLKTYSGNLAENLESFLQPVKLKIMHTIAHVEQLEADYQELKTQKLHYLQDKMSEYQLKIKHQRDILKHARSELHQALLHWGSTLKLYAQQKRLSPF